MRIQNGEPLLSALATTCGLTRVGMISSASTVLSPEKPPSPTPMIQEALEEARRLAHENRLEGKDLDELAELEDDEDEEFLEHYRYLTDARGPDVALHI
jgi:hypothetical protein